jgi:hypothetical protein
MRLLILSIFMMSFSTFANEVNDFEVKKTIKLKQVDYRHRTKISVSVPGFVRIRVRPSYEYRFRFKKPSLEKEITDSL